MAPLVNTTTTTTITTSNNNTNIAYHGDKTGVLAGITNSYKNNLSNGLHSRSPDSARATAGVADSLTVTYPPRSSGAAERPAISLITGVSPVTNMSASTISSNPSSALTTPSTAVSSVTSLTGGGPNSAASSMDDKKRLPGSISAVGEQPMTPASRPLPSLSTSSTAHNSNGNTLPSFHHHHPPPHHPSPFFQPTGSQAPPSINSPFPSPDGVSSRRDEFTPRPFSGYPTAIPVPNAPGTYADGSDFDDDRSRKRYGRPPGAKDKRPRRRRTKAQMEEDALIYGYRDSESVYHSPTSMAKRQRLSPRQDSREGSPTDDANSPPPQPIFSHPNFNNFPPSQPSSSQTSQPPFNPFLHRHHLPVALSGHITALPALKPVEHRSSTHMSTDAPWPPRATEMDRLAPGNQVPDSRAGPGDIGPSRGPPSPVTYTAFPPITTPRGSEPLRHTIFHGDQMDHRGRDLAPKYSPLSSDRNRELSGKWEPQAPVPPNRLPHFGELPRLSDLPLDRSRWARPSEDVPRKPDFDRRSGTMHENKLASISPLNTTHILNDTPPPPPPSSEPNPSQRKTGSPGSSRPPFSDVIRAGPEPPPATAAGDRVIFREGRSGSITNISVGPLLEAETPKRDEEDTDEQIEEYRARMLEQHSSYYNGALGKPRVKREPSYAIPGKSPLQEENERLRSALQRYRQQKGIERLKLEEFINKRCNGEQGMIKELLTITGHIAEDDYVGPVKPSCL